MLQHLKSFVQDEDGAISVDWVVLTAAVVGLQIVILIGIIENSLTSVSQSVAGEVDKYGELLD